MLDGRRSADIHCRVIGHAWDEFDPISLERPPWGVRISLRCIRCTTERHDLVDFLGRVGSRRYIYPPSYPWKEPPTRDDLRLALWHKRIETAEKKGQLMKKPHKSEKVKV